MPEQFKTPLFKPSFHNFLGGGRRSLSSLAGLRISCCLPSIVSAPLWYCCWLDVSFSSRIASLFQAEGCNFTSCLQVHCFDFESCEEGINVSFNNFSVAFPSKLV